ncbi:MAG: pantetheine-phosphate adenylyltransferase [Planctomycetaceae bacterium]
MSRKLNPRVAVYAGSFDPVTVGHLDIVRRGAAIFDQVTVAIGINPDKQPLFSLTERRQMMEEVFADIPNVRVDWFEGLTVDFVQQQGAAVMLRGVRTVSDMESEFNMALANHSLSPEIETVFLMASDRFSHVSSTLIKQIAQLGGEASADRLRQFVPVPVIRPLLEKCAVRENRRSEEISLDSPSEHLP